MTPEAQRIKIAEACGWSVENCHVRGGKNVLYKGVVRHSELFNDALEPTLMLMRPWLPDYLNDLNAMHEAEKILYATPNYTPYRSELAKLGDIVHATAAQRAEAFLRTLGLWRDDA